MKKTLALVVAMIMALSMAMFATAETEKVELDFWDMKWGGVGYVDACTALVEEFNNSQDEIHVTYQSIGWDGYYQTFLTSVTGGSAPDVSSGAFPQAVQYAAMGEILDLSPIWDKWVAENDPILEDYTLGEDLIKMETYGDILAGLPWNQDPRSFWYNKEAFDEAGITELPTTWDEFLECCEKIKTNTDYIPVVLPGNDQNCTQFFIGLMIQNGCGFSNADATGAFENVNQLAECFEFIGNMYENGYLAEGCAGYTGDDATAIFLSGKAAITYRGPMNELKEEGYEEIAEKVFALPAMTGPSGTEAANYVWPNYMMAWSQTEHPEEALTFLEWWIKNVTKIYEDGHMASLPVMASTFEADFYKNDKSAQECLNVVLPGAKGPVSPASVLYVEWATIEGEQYANPGFQAITTGETTDYVSLAQEILDNVQYLFDENA